jgi:hypothetical protein
VARTTQLGDGALDAGARDGATDGAADGALTLGAADGWPADGVLTLGAADGTTGTVGTGVVEVLQAATPRATPAASAKLAAILRIMIHLGSWAEFGLGCPVAPSLSSPPGQPQASGPAHQRRLTLRSGPLAKCLQRRQIGGARPSSLKYWPRIARQEFRPR